MMLLVLVIFYRPFQKGLSIHIDTFWVPAFLKFIHLRCLLIVTTVLEFMFIYSFIVACVVIEVDVLVVVVAGLLS